MNIDLALVLFKQDEGMINWKLDERIMPRAHHNYTREHQYVLCIRDAVPHLNQIGYNEEVLYPITDL